MRLFVLFSVLLATTAQGKSVVVPDTPFLQEYHEAYLIERGPGSEDVRTVAVDKGDRIWIGTAAGVFLLEKGEKIWKPQLKQDEQGPVFDLAVGDEGTVWVGAWNGLFRQQGEGLVRVEGVDRPVAALCELSQGEITCLGPDGMWVVRGDAVTSLPLPCSRNIRAVIPGSQGGLWIATGMGLYFTKGEEKRLYQQDDEIMSSDVEDVAYTKDGSLWAGGFGGVSVYRDGQLQKLIPPSDGLPTIYVQSVACGPDGRMWVGTTEGVARFDGNAWSLRHSKRWLVDDDVRDVAFDSEGTAWIAAAGGVSAIKSKKMTLAEKADYYLDVLYKRHVRDPWYVEKCLLPKPGDPSVWKPMDDDNDGEYTGNYVVMESFRWAVTKDPKAKQNAKRGFDALRFLETVNGIPGFISRTAVPATWEHVADPNRTYTPRELAELRVRDPRFKPVEKRWHASADGKWLWKGDTSSDEMTGHFFAYHYYYDLVADEAEKEVVREHVRRIMDYLIDNGYVLIGVDGTHTRWAVWAPEKIGSDPDWRAERGVNAIEILSFLKVTHHITGDEKYQREYLRLLHDHDYASYARHGKTSARAWNTHIDDSLLVEAYPGLLKYEEDPELRSLFLESLNHWYEGIRHEHNPFFNFINGSLKGEDPELEDSVAFLRDCPLDLVNWRIDNSRREDLQIVRGPVLEELSTSRLLPPSERGVVRWDKNPWMVAQGDGGHTEWATTFWLMPYWIGRYYGFIGSPE